MDQTAAILQAIADLSKDVATLQSASDVIAAEMAHVNEHFERLNGSVARHEAALSVAALDAARVAALAAEKAKWERRLMPAVWFIAIGLVFLILQNSPAVLRAVTAGR